MVCTDAVRVHVHEYTGQYFITPSHMGLVHVHVYTSLSMWCGGEYVGYYACMF